MRRVESWHPRTELLGAQDPGAVAPGSVEVAPGCGRVVAGEAGARTARCVAGALLVGLLLGVTLPARAEVIDEKEVPHLSVGFMLGYAGARMDRFNQNIRVVNHFLEHQGLPLRAADKMVGRASAQGEVRYKFNDHFSLGLGAANVEARSSFSVAFAQVDFYARTTALSPMLYYHLPFVQNAEAFLPVADRMSIYLGAGPVFLTKGYGLVRIIDRTIEPVFNVDGDLGELDGEGYITGTGTGLRGLVGASYQLTGRFSFAAEIGYRYGKINNPKIGQARGFERAVAENDPNRREPGDQAIKDFFEREQRAAGLPEQDINRNHIPYYSDYQSPLNLNFSGVTLQAGFRIHI